MVARTIHKARKLGRTVANPSYRWALLLGVVAGVEHDSDPLPGDLRMIVDVGANRGQFALVAARRWPSAVLICVEPLVKPRKTLRRALRRHRLLQVIDAAASDASGAAFLHVSRSDDSSSLRAITARQTHFFPGTEEVGTVSVRTVRLDEVITISAHERPALLKIDVQGGELDVLHGATGLLSMIDFVLVESSFTELYSGQALADDVIRFLHSEGFALSTVLAPTLGRDGVVVQADLLFSQVSTDGA